MAEQGRAGQSFDELRKGWTMDARVISVPCGRSDYREGTIDNYSSITAINRGPFLSIQGESAIALIA